MTKTQLFTHFSDNSHTDILFSQCFTKNISFSKDIASKFEKCGSLKNPNYVINVLGNGF